MDMFIDPLTGVYGRDALNQRLQEEIERSCRYQIAFSLILLDLDHFKSINDAFGHSRGDQVLVEFSKRLAGMVRGSDLVFRYGGDEFVILLPHTDKSQAISIAQRLLDEIRSTPFAGDPPLSLSMSMGIASSPQDANTAQVLFELADKRHYIAKRQGRGRVIGEEIAGGADTPLAEPSRLIGCDQALQSLQAFLSALPEQKYGVLQVQGTPGVGKSRFLRETLQAARLLGYIVLEIRGRPALRNRVYGALSETLHERALPSPWEGFDVFRTAIQRWLIDKGSAGLLIVVDELQDVDQASLDFLREVFFSAQIPQIGLAYSVSGTAGRSGLDLDVPVRETVVLEPLSEEGVHIWVRHSLQWEAPQSFIHWLHHETNGLPKLVHQGLMHLAAQDILQRTSNGWRSERDLAQYRLGDLLAQQAAAAARHNLPIGLTEFVGREDELYQLKALIREQSLVTLVGPGGIGKSRLAVQAAAESIDLFPDGVYLVSLAAVRQASMMVTAIADALRYTFSGAEDPADQLIGYLRAKELLLILDTMEHLRDDLRLLERIRDEAPGVQLFVTSHERLDLPGEAVFDLPGLDCPQGVTRDQLQRSTAVQLFLRSAQRARPDFILDAETGVSVARICQLVEGMPLGLELAAAWVGTFSPQEIVRYIESTVGFLVTEQVSLPERHRSLLVVFDSFFQLLSDHELSTLRQLTVFRGGFRGDAARQIVGASPFFLDGLVAKAYLRRMPLGRYEMHQLLWQYAREKLAAHADEIMQVQQRHSQYYADFVHQKEYLLPGSYHVVDEFSAEMTNLRAAWEWAVHQVNFTILGRSSRGLAQYYALTGLFQEGESLFSQAVRHIREAAESLPEHAEAKRSAYRRFLGWLLVIQASFFKELGRSSNVAPLIEEAVAIAQENQDISLEALAMLEWGRAQMVQDLKSARVKVERAQALAQKARETPAIPEENALSIDERFAQSVEAHCCRLLGVIAARGGNIPKARTYFEQALDVQRALKNLDDESNILNNLGMLEDIEGKHQSAREYFLQSMHIKRMLGNKTGLARALHNLGNVSKQLGDYSQALDFFEQALLIWRDTGNWSNEGKTLNDLGDLALLQGDLLRAISYNEQAIKIHLKSGNKNEQGEASESLGEVYQYVGDYGRGREKLEAALACYQAAGELNNQARALSKLGLLFLALGNKTPARENLEHALRLAQRIGLQSIQALALNGLGRLYASEGDFAAAKEAYDRAVELRESTNELHQAIEPFAGLAQLALEQSNLDEASNQVERILQYLDVQAEASGKGIGKQGSSVSGLVYQVCYRVLAARSDPRTNEILQRAGAWLLAQAERISDESLRRSFLRRIPVHREIMSEYERLHLGEEPPSPG